MYEYNVHHYLSVCLSVHVITEYICHPDLGISDGAFPNPCCQHGFQMSNTSHGVIKCWSSDVTYKQYKQRSMGVVGKILEQAVW